MEDDPGSDSGLTRMPAYQRESLALWAYLNYNGTARSRLRGFGFTAEEIAGFFGKFERAGERAREAELLLSQHEVTGFRPQGTVRHVADHDGGTGADEVGTKRCRNCGADLPTAAFNVRRLSPDGLAIWCRNCGRGYHRTRAGQQKLREAATAAGVKVCGRCGEEKPLDQFWEYRLSTDGHRDVCISCTDR